MSKGVIILQVDARDFMRLKMAKMKFTRSGLQFICGKNGAGKSAVMAGFEAVLLGMAHNPAMPVHEDADKGAFAITMEKQDDTGNPYKIHVEQVWRNPEKKSGPRFTVKSDGPPITEPRKTFSQMFSDIRFDLRGFIDGKKPEHMRTRRDAVLKTVPGLADQLTVLAEKRKAIFDQRTDVGRDVKRLTATIDLMEEPEEGLPEKEQSVVDLSHALRGIEETIQDKAHKEGDVESITLQIDNAKANISDLEEQLAEEKKLLAISQGSLLDAQTRLATFEDDAVLETKHAEAEENINVCEQTNRNIRQAQAYRQTEGELSVVREQHDAFTKQITSLDRTKDVMLRSAEFPIEGLSVSENDITYNGKPWSVAATSEGLRVALAVGMAQEPELRAMFVRDGNCFDPDSLKQMDEITVEADYQVFLEYVVRGKADAQDLNGFYIEEGVYDGVQGKQ